MKNYKLKGGKIEKAAVMEKFAEGFSPNWKAVSMFYYRAQKKGVWEKILKMLVKKTRKAYGRNEEPTYALIDSQSVKTTAASENRGYDGGKNERTQTTYRNRYAWKSAVCSRSCSQYT